MELIVRLFWEFFKTGLFAVGGGLATLPFLYEISAKTGWFTTNDIANMIAVSESTPGAIGINMATYVGYTTVGMFGGIITTIGLILPAVIIIIIISGFLKKFKESETVKRVFYGLRPASTGLIAAAGLGVAKICMLNVSLFETTGSVSDLFNLPTIILGIILYIGLVKFKKHPIVYIAVAAAAGIAFQL